MKKTTEPERNDDHRPIGMLIQWIEEQKADHICNTREVEMIERSDSERESWQKEALSMKLLIGRINV
jgi:hypothetical protein